MSDLNPFTVQTASGKYFDLSDPYNSPIDIDDIAASLAKTCRFNGHCKDLYSVAQHSVHVSKLVEERTDDPHLALVALLHDAHEAYTGDITRPMKKLLEAAAPGVLASIENDIADAIFKEFGIFDWNKAMWDEADVIAYVTETRDQMRHMSQRAVEADPAPIEVLSHPAAEVYFLKRYDDLLDQTGEW
jgi:uncharacterized protein